MKVRSPNEMKDDPQPNPTTMPACRPNFVNSGTEREGEVFGSTALKRKKGMKVTRVCVHGPRHDLKGLREKIR